MLPENKDYCKKLTNSNPAWLDITPPLYSMLTWNIITIETPLQSTSYIYHYHIFIETNSLD